MVFLFRCISKDFSQALPDLQADLPTEKFCGSDFNNKGK